jgi:hypothetical protein
MSEFDHSDDVINAFTLAILEDFEAGTSPEDSESLTMHVGRVFLDQGIPRTALEIGATLAVQEVIAVRAEMGAL